MRSLIALYNICIISVHEKATKIVQNYQRSLVIGLLREKQQPPDGKSLKQFTVSIINNLQTLFNVKALHFKCSGDKRCLNKEESVSENFVIRFL